MKKFKSTVALFTALLMLISAFAVPVFAETGTTAITVGSTATAVEPGSEISIPVTIENNTGFAGATFDVVYDSDVLTPATKLFVLGSALSEQTDMTLTAKTSANLSAVADNFSADGEILTLHFTVNESAAVCNTKIALKLQNDDEDNFSNINGIAVPVEFTAGIVAIKGGSHNYGDTKYTWSDDGSSCTAEHACTVDGCTNAETAVATISKKTKTAATCTLEGTTTYTATFSEDWAENQTLDVQDIKIAEHTVVTDKAVPATCTTDGLTEGSHCSVCNKVFKAQEVVKATGHKYGATQYTWADNGSYCVAKRSCTVDGCTASETANAAITSKVTKPVTCVSNGTTTYTATFSESWAETQTKDVQGVELASHTIVTDKAVAATCTKDGLTEGSHCSVCKTVFKAQEVIKAYGHTPKTVGVVAVTMTSDGYTGDTVCATCNTVISKGSVIPAGTHNCYDDNGDGYCDFCGTDLIGRTTQDNCSCDCHKTGFTKFIWKIKVFFWKLFNSSSHKYCECGVSHW